MGPFKPAVRETVRRQFRQRLENAGIPLIDLSPIDGEFTLREFEVNLMDAYPNERMHAVMGRRLYDQLLPFVTDQVKSAAMRGRRDP
jgi:hypothetical protein